MNNSIIDFKKTTAFTTMTSLLSFIVLISCAFYLMPAENNQNVFFYYSYFTMVFILTLFVIIINAKPFNKTPFLEKQTTMSIVVAQLAHDIRSPLATLDLVIKDILHISAEQNALLNRAMRRISEIANNLLAQYRNEGHQTNDLASKTQPERIIDLLLEVIHEKKIQYQYYLVEFLPEFAQSANHCTANISASAFKRVISNLLDNAVEALANNALETVTIRVSAQARLITISIIDSGSGIAPGLLKEILSGKSVSQKPYGNGLGLTHAMHMVKNEWHGQFIIESQVNVGTRIDIILLQC
ncbi:MAG TPA: HAMP domain-containing sensor histidine kinase [Gammaproteobacteria bacterium]|jgi:signal transduction histidine kinase|nr:HAMP domain-containing sensor histidine kinase [Gammaproteobacteria bacterium]